MITKKNNRKLKRTNKKINYHQKKLTKKKTGGSRRLRAVKGFFGRLIHDRERNFGIDDNYNVIIKCNGKDELEYGATLEVGPNKIAPQNNYLSYDPKSYVCQEKEYVPGPSTNILQKENDDIYAMRIGNKGPMYPYERTSIDKSAKFRLTFDNHKSMKVISNVEYQLPRLRNTEETSDPVPIYVLSEILVDPNTERYQSVMEFKTENKKLKTYTVKSMREISVSPAKITDDEKDKTHPQFNYHYTLFQGTSQDQKIIEKILKGNAHEIFDEGSPTENPLFVPEYVTAAAQQQNPSAKALFPSTEFNIDDYRSKEPTAECDRKRKKEFPSLPIGKTPDEEKDIIEMCHLEEDLFQKEKPGFHPYSSNYHKTELLQQFIPFLQSRQKVIDMLQARQKPIENVRNNNPLTKKRNFQDEKEKIKRLLELVTNRISKKNVPLYRSVEKTDPVPGRHPRRAPPPVPTHASPPVPFQASNTVSSHNLSSHGSASSENTYFMVANSGSGNEINGSENGRYVSVGPRIPTPPPKGTRKVSVRLHE